MIPAIYINCSWFPFIRDIMSLKKLYETRTRNMLGRFLGERILLIETGHGRPVVRCSAVISEIIEVYTREKWNKYRNAACIPEGSQYDWQPGTQKKVLYRLTNVQPVRPFYPTGTRHGRTWMECKNAPQDMSNTDRMTTIESFIEIFEDFLEEKRIDIPNGEKTDDPYASTIYGTDYFNLSDRIEALLVKHGVLQY